MGERMKLALIGFGVVGQGLARILLDKADELRNEQQFTGEIVAVATRSRGTLYQPNGLSIPKLLDAIGRGSLNQYPDEARLARNQDILTLIRECSADAVVECTHTDFQSGQPAADYCAAALESGKHVVLANKGPVAVAYAELRALAAKTGKRLLFEATVMAGTPCIRLAQTALAGCRIEEARGILNGTTNYILTQMEGGLSYADALADAQRLGYAEADPTADVSGRDAVGKLLILSQALFNRKLTIDQVAMTGITGITPADIEAARAAGERYKLIARVSREGCSVRPERIPTSDPLAAVSGATNAITYQTDLLGPVTLVGAGAGGIQTGFGLLADLLALPQ
jgi:homoserine dehydrogenase